jgi:uncharacterized protein (DUF849 family)
MRTEVQQQTATLKVSEDLKANRQRVYQVGLEEALHQLKNRGGLVGSRKAILCSLQAFDYAIKYRFFKCPNKGTLRYGKIVGQQPCEPGRKEEDKMKAYGNKPTLSRRDFVATAAASICGMTATLLSGEKSVGEDAAQESERHTPSGRATVLNKLIITVSPSGADPHQTSSTDIAKDPKRHADAILEGFHAGASVVHIRGASAVEKNPDVLHGHGADLNNWKEVTDLVRSRCNIVINYGSSAMEPPVRKPLLALKPEAASFLVGHHYTGMAVLPDFQRQSALNHLEAGVLPEVEIFHTGDMANLNALIKTGVLRPPYCVTLFFNYDAYYAVPPTLPLLQGQLGLMSANAHWTICAKGPNTWKWPLMPSH